jgi:hypothetical protein
MMEAGTEIGDFPSNESLEHYRWNGFQLIRLDKHPGPFFVEHVNGKFIIHIIPTPNSHLVEMTYADRKNLITNGGHPRVKTQEEMDEEEKVLDFVKSRSKLFRSLRDKSKEDIQRILLTDLDKVLFFLIKHTLNPTQATTLFLTTYHDALSAVFKLADEGPKLVAHAQKKATAIARFPNVY